MSDDAKTQTFEAAMDRLDAVVEQMENARLPLEDLIRLYEEGSRLVKTCGERLAAAEQRIELITRDAAGQPRVTEFTAAAVAAIAETKPNLPKPPRVAAPAPAPQAAYEDNEVSLF